MAIFLLNNSGDFLVKRKLSDLLDEINDVRPTNFWHTRLIEMQALLKEKKYSALERRIHDLLQSDMATGRVKPPKIKLHQSKDRD